MDNEINTFEYILDQLQQIPFSMHHGFELKRVDEQSIDLTVKLEDYMKNPYGMPHGGILFLLMDSCSGLLSRTDRRRHVTVDANIHYLTSTKTKYLNAHGEIVRRGKKTCVIDTKVYDQDGVLLAIGTVTMFCIDD